MPEITLTDILLWTKIGSCLFFAILFLQSGLDKVFDYKGNASWIQEHFSKSFLKSGIPLMLPLLMITELFAGSFSLWGAFDLFFDNGKQFAFYGLLLSILSLLFLFFGQRFAKDYVGAADIAVYFGVSLLSILLFSV